MHVNSKFVTSAHQGHIQSTVFLQVRVRLQIFWKLTTKAREAAKLGSCTEPRFLSPTDELFVADVRDDLLSFLAKIQSAQIKSVLLFPPVNSRRRFLIHRCCEELAAGLATFSVGGGDDRRTAAALLSDVVGIKPGMGLSQTECRSLHQSSTGAAGGACGAASPRPAQEHARSAPARQRRPDRAVYVPRALRAADPAPPAAASHPSTPRRSLDRRRCELYTPPHLRAAHRSPDRDPPSGPNDRATSDSGFDDSQFSNLAPADSAPNDSVDVDEADLPDASCVDYDERDANFFADEPIHDACPDGVGEIDMSVPEPRDGFIGGPYGSKDEDVDRGELERASREINRSNRRIIKQSFDSDVLVISDPVDEKPAEDAEPEEDGTVETTKKKLEARVSLKREENDWDAVFDDDGECLDPSLLEELSSMVGKAHISKPKNNYEAYLEKGASAEGLGHVVEVYDFPAEFKTNDLLSVFAEYKETGFEIKWVDDTHALIVFSSAKIAAEVMSNPQPMVRCRPLSEATADSRGKAKRCAQFLQPYRQRPETCTALARRLVSGALGVKLSTARQERDEERRLIGIARERKRQAALHKEAAWDGSLADSPHESPQLHDT